MLRHIKELIRVPILILEALWYIARFVLVASRLLIRELILWIREKAKNTGDKIRKLL